jgi:ATP-dependent DNA ligase
MVSRLRPDCGPPPVALARPTTRLVPVGLSAARWEPKLDGWRAVWAYGRLWSRRGVDISRLFPDLVPVLAGRLSDGVIVDAEAVVVGPATRRTEFASLSQRLTAGRRLRQLAAERPAQLVCFDVLALGGTDLRHRPLRERRRILERILVTTQPPIALCEQTADPATAAAWFADCLGLGIEGVVIKSADGTYPTRAGCRVWYKLRRRRSVDLVVTAVIGDPGAPTALVLSVPTGAGEFRTVGVTTRLAEPVAADIGRLATPTGATARHYPAMPGTGGGPVVAAVVEPVVVEVSADTAVDNGRLRHAARFLRARPDLTVADARIAMD